MQCKDLSGDVQGLNWKGVYELKRREDFDGSGEVIDRTIWIVCAKGETTW